MTTKQAKQQNDETDDEETVIDQNDEGDDGEQNEQPDGDEGGEEQTTEDRARSMGWRPKEDFKGKEGQWVDADEFVRRSDEDPREVRKANHVLMRKVQKLESGIEAILSHQEREITNARQQEYARAHAQLKRDHDDAVASGDVDAAGKVWKARESLANRQVEESRGGNNPPAPSADDNALIATWTQENASWYNKNYDATMEANAYEDWLAKQGVPLADRLQQTAVRIKQKYFGQQQRQPGRPPAPVGGNNNNGTVRSGRKPKPGSYEALTPAARAECDRTVRSSGGKVTKEAWLQYATPDLFIQ